MNCPNCGANLPDGSAFCNFCGTQFQQANPYTNPYNAAPVNQYNAAPAATAKKAPTAAIIAGIVILLAVAAIIVVLVTKGGKSGNKDVDGNYVLYKMDYAGMTYDEDDIIASTSANERNLKIKGDTVTFNGASADIEYDGNDFTISDASGEMDGEYVPDDDEIILYATPYTMYFRRK